MHTALLLEMAADAFGERTAVVSKSRRLTYSELLESARNAASLIGRERAQTVAYVGLNSEAFPIALFGSLLAVKPFAPINYRLTDPDLRRVLARITPGLAIADDNISPRIAGIDGITVLTRSKFLQSVSYANASDESAVPAAPEDTAVLLFTSGTTGEPKAALLRHRHLTSYVIGTVEFMGAGEDEAALVSVPPYHIAGISTFLTATYLGRRIVQLDNFVPEHWVSTARDESITHAMVVPTMLSRILEVLEKTGDRLPCLKHLAYGGGRMPAVTIVRALQLLPHVDFVNAYGLTETSSTIAVLTPQDHRDAASSNDARVHRRLASVGRPLPTLELEIRDAEGRYAPPGVPGEIWVRGDQVSGEYVGQKAVRDDGWFPTKDRGWLDENGFLFVDGRLDDIIVRGGENISPGEIEDVLRLHPAVLDVAVLGLPDNEWGERVAAVIVTQENVDPDALRSWVRERLRSTKAPEEIFFRSSLPYNETGKLLRRALRTEFAA